MAQLACFNPYVLGQRLNYNNDD